MKNIKVGDIAVIIAVLLVTAGMIAFRFFGNEKGECVVITVEGNETVYSLKKDKRININGKDIELVVVIENGAAFVGESKCPNQSCVGMGKISDVGEVIACVPAEVYVKIIGEGGGGYDQVIG